MSIETEPQLGKYKDWTFRLRKPHEKSQRLMVLIHGWKGDENSMWLLSQNLPSTYTIIAPRGPFSVPEGGYSWREIKPGTWGKASMEELLPVAENLLKFVEEWTQSMGTQSQQFDVMGFSQGAAMTYTLAISHPERIGRMAALAGFIPENAEGLLYPESFRGKPIFISHGRADNMIPVEQARTAVKVLEKAGAKVIYCESDASHKVSKDCLVAMNNYFRNF